MTFLLPFFTGSIFRNFAKVNFVKLHHKAWLLIKHAVNFYT